MGFFERGIHAKVMSTELIVEANVSKKILFECLDLAREFEAKYSAYKEDSLLSKINQNAGIKEVPCSKKELEIFQRAFDMAQASEGIFDPTIGALSQGTYGFGHENPKIPSQQELQNAHKLVNYKALHVRDNGVYLTKKEMRLDLGGIGKGYVADEILKHLQSRGATKALVSVGGEMLSFGKKYNIAIQNPFDSGSIAVIKTSPTILSISTSGDYERFIGSRENHHILDTTLAKQNHHYSSITILKNGLDATLLDGVSTVAFNTKPDVLDAIAKEYGVAIISVNQKQELCVSNLSALEIRGLEVFGV